MKIWKEMAKDLAEQLGRIGHKAELLLTRYNMLAGQNTTLKARVQELEDAISARDALIERQKLELEHLRVSSAFAPNTATARQTRTMLSELVREIDACVADLMKDV